MDILATFSIVLGLLVAFGAGAMVWGARQLARDSDRHRSG